MKPVLHRYKDTESVIKVMDGYTPGEDWAPLYSQAQVDELQAQLVYQQASYEVELAATEIAIAEYRQQCLDNAAEIARLKSESEERLQNCAALVAENEQLRKDAERYQWLKSAKGLTLESERGVPWTRENGSTFIPSHRLCAGGTQFAPHETLDDAIDAAMKGTP